MSRYLILVLLNLPLVIIAIIGAFVSYKIGHLSKRRLILKVTFWALVIIGLIFTKPIYEFLNSAGLTQTQPLSLFDVTQITAIIYIFYLVNRLFGRVDMLEHRVQGLHQELSIRLSKK